MLSGHLLDRPVVLMRDTDIAFGSQKSGGQLPVVRCVELQHRQYELFAQLGVEVLTDHNTVAGNANRTGDAPDLTPAFERQQN